MKKAAPVKESGLKAMQANSNSWSMDTHEQFLLNELVPLVVGYAVREGHPTAAAALAAFLALSDIMQHKGIARAELIAALDPSRTIHDAPEGLQ